MKANEIRKMTTEEIVKNIKDSKIELLDLRMKGSLEKPSKINVVKKDIARMMTILKERENSIGGNE